MDEWVDSEACWGELGDGRVCVGNQIERECGNEKQAREYLSNNINSGEPAPEKPV